jgi:hypothetical protein
MFMQSIKIQRDVDFFLHTDNTIMRRVHIYTKFFRYVYIISCLFATRLHVVDKVTVRPQIAIPKEQRMLRQLLGLPTFGLSFYSILPDMHMYMYIHLLAGNAGFNSCCKGAQLLLLFIWYG